MREQPARDEMRVAQGLFQRLDDGRAAIGGGENGLPVIGAFGARSRTAALLAEGSRGVDDLASIPIAAVILPEDSAATQATAAARWIKLIGADAAGQPRRRGPETPAGQPSATRPGKGDMASVMAISRRHPSRWSRAAHGQEEVMTAGNVPPAISDQSRRHPGRCRAGCNAVPVLPIN